MNIFFELPHPSFSNWRGIYGNIHKLCCILFFVLLSWIVQTKVAQAQSTAIKQLKEQLLSEKTDTGKVFLYNELSFQYIFSLPDTAEVYLEKANQIAQKNNYTRGIAQNLNHKGILYRAQGFYPDAIDFHLKSLQLFEALNDNIGIANNYINIGLVYYNQGNYNQAIEYYKKCLELKRNSTDQMGVAFAMNDIGDIYTRKGDYAKAQQYYFESLEFSKKMDSVSRNRTNVGTFRSIGILYQLQKDYDRSLGYLLKALQFYEKGNDHHGMVEVCNHLAEVYHLKGEQANAFTYYQKAKEVGEKYNAKMSLRNTYKGLANYFATQQDFPKAFEALQRYVTLQDSLFNIENTEKIAKLQSSFQTKKKQIEIELLKKEKRLKEEQSKRQNLSIYGLMAGLGLIIVITVLQFRNNQRQRKTNYLLHQQKEEIAEKNSELERINEHITASIKYAKRIQTAMLPFEERLKKSLLEYFILFLPKDIVSGDFYWFQAINSEEGFEPENDSLNRMMLAVADCTGHGVPGAFMSLIGSSFLTELVTRKKIINPAQILEELHHYIRYALNQTEKGNDGMDIGICYMEDVDERHKKLTYAGAKRPLYYISKDTKEVQLLAGDRKSLGGAFNEIHPFTNQEIILPTGSLIYLCSDGYIDQNDVKRKKLGEETFKEMLLQNQFQTMAEQKTALAKALAKHQYGTTQRDDILIFGVKL